MIEILLLFPLISCIILFLIRLKGLNIMVNILYAIVYLTISILLYLKPIEFNSFFLKEYFRVDSLNIIFLLVLGILYFCISFYNIDFLKHSNMTPFEQTLYSSFLLIFICSMTGVILSTHLAMLWVFVEATTLSSAYLIYSERTESSLEATWKYLFICSIGIALAFVGITMLSIGTKETNLLFFDNLYKNAGAINTFWLKLSFAFILVGFGTKVGLAPVHAWLPDAHSESPPPISALLSGALLSTVFLGILRIFRVMELANLGIYAQTLLLIMGFLSLFVCAVFIGNINNYKRMLAYSSIENMGIITIGIGIGGIGKYAAMLHLVAHSFVKTSFFLTSGNILRRFGTKDIDKVTGILKKDTISGWLWILCFIAISGIPPSPIFISEFLIVRAMFVNGNIGLAIIFLLLLTVIIFGFGNLVLKMGFGKEIENISGDRFSLLSYAPHVILLVILAIIGVYMPEFLNILLKNAVLGL